MKGKIVGLEPMNYVSKKTNQEVKGVRLYLNYFSSDVIGCKTAEEFIGSTSPFYKQLERYLASDIDSLVDSDVFIDYNVETRGSNVYKTINDFSVTPVPKGEAVIV